MGDAVRQWRRAGPGRAALVAAEIRLRIINGEYGTGDMLPPAGSVAVALGTTPPTVYRALGLLQDQGIVRVTRRRTRGGAPYTEAEVLVDRWTLPDDGGGVRDAREGLRPVVQFGYLEWVARSLWGDD